MNGSSGQHGPRQGGGDLLPGIRELGGHPLAHGIPIAELDALARGGALALVSLDRDVFVLDALLAGGAGPGLFYILQGQIAMAVFDPAVMAERKAQQDRFARMSEEERQELSALKPPPLAREARKNLATFMVGDMFNAAAVRGWAPGDVSLFTVEPTSAVVFTAQALAGLIQRFPFFQNRIRRAVELGTQRLRRVVGIKQEILDFYIRQGVSVSGETIRVRQLDSCIDCKQCEMACEDRYGSKRLTLGGYQLGMLDFVFTCRTCRDQRCIPPCEYDAIRFDPEIQEVVINEASCTGCTLCAQACPYEAIELVDVEDPVNPTFRAKFRARLETEGSLAWGPGRPRVMRPRRIANKCDHCMNFSDQACVSACPTGALIEVSAYDLFHERSAGSVLEAQSGYSQQLPPDRGEALPVKPFTLGIGVRNAGLAKTRRGRLIPVAVWGLALAAWVLALAEILLRLHRPKSSIQYVFLREEMDPSSALYKVGYHAGGDLAVWCGVVGTVLMLIAIVYVPLRRIRAFRRVASNTMWFDFHLMAGTMGPAFIVLHSDLKLDTWLAAPFWAMMIVFVSGVVGRYLYTQVPDLTNGRELEELDHTRAFQVYRASYAQAMSIVDSLLGPHAHKAERVAERSGILGSLWWIIMEDVRRPARWLRRRRVFRRAEAPRDVVNELRHRTGRMLLIQRRRVLAPRAQLLLHSWKKVHVPFSFVMAALAVAHIWIDFGKAF